MTAFFQLFNGVRQGLCTFTNIFQFVEWNFYHNYSIITEALRTIDKNGVKFNILNSEK